MKKQLILLLLSLFYITWGYAQEPSIPATLKLKFDKSGHVKYIKFDGKNKTGNWNSPASAEGFFKNVLNANKQDEFVLKNKREKKGGLFTEHYRQFYQGVEVEGGIFILHFKNGKLTKANGHYINTAGVDPLPKLTPSEAAQSYATYLQISNASSLKFIHGMVVVEIETISGIDTTFNARLCYKIDLLGSFDNKGETGYIDAHTGKVLKTQKNWYNTSATGTFSTLYSGTRSAGTQYYNNVYNLIDSSRNAIINTWDLNNELYSTYSTNADEFTDNDNNWTADEHDDNNDQMALDIHWGLQEIYDYFDEEHELQSFDNNNHMIDAFVHCEFPDGNSWTKDNAAFVPFANGDQAFFFGDGESVFKPLGALDVVAHEFSHAITHNHTGWATLTTVRRAMHEGFSDIWAVVIENEVAPEKDHWKIGEEVIDVAGDDCLRNIQNPESLTSYTQIADCFGDDRYNDGGNDEVYEKSGILSHWFYLLSEGGDGQNDNNDDYLVYGLGIDMAAKVVFEGQTGHFADVDNYTEARTAMVDAADDLFDENSFQSLQVENAWYAVGIGSQPMQVTLSGPSSICTSNSTYTINNLPSGSSVNWTHTNNLSYVSGQGTVNYTVSAISNSIGVPDIITATISNASCQDVIIQKEVYSSPYFSNFEIQVPVSPVNGDYDFVVWASGLPAQITNYNWTVSNGYIVSQDLNEIIIHPTSCTLDPRQRPVTINVTANNTCGSASAYTSVPVDCDGGIINPLSVQPNPANDYIDAEIIDTDPEIDNNKLQIKLFNYRSIPVYMGNSNQKSFRINTSHLPHGLYILQVIYKGNKYNKQVLIEH